jgi:endonuclease/exonuclease/phosphatase family metal-dependent hydrolase
MLRRRFVALSIGPVLAVGLLSVPATAPPAEAVSSPASITAVSAVPGAQPGQVLFRWTSSGAHTDYFLLETGLTSFSKTSTSLPRSGRNAKTFLLPASARSWTMSATRAASAGAPLGSANHLYYRLFAINKEGSNSVTKAYPYLQTVLPQTLPAPRQKKGTDMRVATFNVRTAKATADKRNWLKRKDDVAAEIMATRAGVVLLQEVSPGRADGKGGSTKGIGRQTTTLVDALATIGGSYAMVRTTSYLKSGLPRGTQGGRILYDTKRYELLSTCPEKTGKSTHNASCSFKLPILSSDGENKRRRGGYALLQNKKTGQKFWAVSAHFDERHSGSAATRARYDKLRGDQARAILSLLQKENTKNYPVIFGADINTWQNDRVGYAGHDVMVSGGFYDTAAATVRTNQQYSTSNQFKITMTRASSGFGSRLDVVMIKGSRGADLWVNKMAVTDATRPSDHNLVYADIVI